MIYILKLRGMSEKTLIEDTYVLEAMSATAAQEQAVADLTEKGNKFLSWIRLKAIGLEYVLPFFIIANSPVAIDKYQMKDVIDKTGYDVRDDCENYETETLEDEGYVKKAYSSPGENHYALTDNGVVLYELLKKHYPREIKRVQGILGDYGPKVDEVFLNKMEG